MLCPITLRSGQRWNNLHPDIAGGIRTVSRVNELGYTILEHLEGVSIGGQPPLIPGDDSGSEEFDRSEGRVRVHLVDTRAAGIVGPQEQQPTRLSGVAAVDSDDRP